MTTGRYVEALDVIERLKAYGDRAGWGPWSRLGNEGRRLQVLNCLGRHEEVLETVDYLRMQMRSLPNKIDEELDNIEPWHVRESILEAGGFAAERLAKFDLASEFDAEVLGSMESRGATDLELARTRINGFGQLLRLRRYEAAERLLWSCKLAFERERSIELLGQVFSYLAILMYYKRQPDQAASFEETALRYKYLFGDPDSISLSHKNLADYLVDAKSSFALDHRLASAIISYQIGSGLLMVCLEKMAGDLDDFGPESLSKSFDQLCHRVERVEGVKFRMLFERLAGSEVDGDQVIRDIIEKAKEGNLFGDPEI